MIFKKPDLFKSPIERYVQEIEKRMGAKANVFREKGAQKKMSFVYTLGFENVKENQITAFSYGFSFEKHNAQEHLIELSLQVQSLEKNWIHIVGFLANNLRGDCPFNTGEIIKIGGPISPDSKMNGFVVFTPDFLENNEPIYDTKKSTGIHLVQLVPIYESEIQTINKIGLKRFAIEIQDTKQNPNRRPI